MKENVLYLHVKENLNKLTFNSFMWKKNCFVLAEVCLRFLQRLPSGRQCASRVNIAQFGHLGLFFWALLSLFTPST